MALGIKAGKVQAKRWFSLEYVAIRWNPNDIYASTEEKSQKKSVLK